MELKLNIKPTKYVAGSHAEILRMVRGGSYAWCGSGGSGYSFSGFSRSLYDRNDTMVRVYSLEKHRKVVKLLDKPKKLTAKQKRDMMNAYPSRTPADDGMLRREVVWPAKWVAFVYDIPMEMIKLCGLDVKQGNRTFTIAPHKSRR